MKIISNYRDYYDHQAHVYGGGDPKIVYVRNHKHITVPELDFWDWKCKSVDILQDVYMLHYDSRNDYNPELRGIVIGDIFFAQIRYDMKSDYVLLQEKDIKHGVRSEWFWRNKQHKLDMFINHVDSSLIDFCKHINIPVFMFNVTREKLIVDVNCPNLGKLGIASYISAEQMYQHLSYFIGNKMKDNPDTIPPVNVDDKFKIMGHGFDIKRSFRNVK